MPRPIHFEIPADNPEPLTKFYAALFGWRFQKAPFPGPEYWLADTTEPGAPPPAPGNVNPGINGAIMKRQDPRQPMVNYIDVPSIDLALAKATTLGAKIALPKTPVANIGAYAAIIDPQGNICGLWERVPGM